MGCIARFCAFGAGRAFSLGLGVAKLGDLTPDPANARKHNPRNVGQIERSIERNGFGRSLLLANDGTIIAGNATYDAAASAGLEDVLVIETDGTKVIALKRTDVEPGSKQFHQLAVEDNRTAELAEWDADVLRQLAEADKITLDEYFFDEEQRTLDLLASLDQPLTDPDDVPAVPDEPITKPGDLWVLGGHRLLCGDATVVTDVERLMGGERADVCLTDPPYGINAVTGKKGQWGGVAERYRPIENDQDADVTKDVFRLVSAMQIPVQIWWGANHYCSVLPDSPCWIVWYKRDGNDGNDFADCELAWTNQPSPARLIQHQWNGFLKASEKDEDRTHPTQKPVALSEFCLSEYSKPNDLIVDLFGGSGSTLIACEQSARRCAMLEIDPHYCDVIVTRWQNFTGQTARLDGASIAQAAD